MEFITSAVLSGLIYDMLKHQVYLTANNIKEKLKDWIVDEAISNAMEKELHALQLTDEMSESLISKKITSSNELTALIAKIKPGSNPTIIQTHSGTGDNIGGHKITNL